MISPAPVNPPGQIQMGDVSPGMKAESPSSASATQRFFDTFGFHVLAVLLGIALAFM